MWIRVISLRSEKARMTYFFALALIAMLLLVPQRGQLHAQSPNSYKGPVYRVITSHKAMALTINVVWGTGYVPSILQTLVAHHVKATFMLGGAWASAHPDLVRQMQKAGMELGNHGYAHRHVSALSLQANLDEIERTNTAVAGITGTLPKVFAPPYGEFNSTVLKAAESAKMPLIMWTIDTIDWRPSSSPALIESRVLKRVQPGAIVLMHPTERTRQALPAMVTALSDQGYHLVTVSDLLTMGHPTGDG